jgi:N-acetylmuramoyl-L-alanine amidase
MPSPRPLFHGVVVDYGHGGVINGVYQNPTSKQYTFTDHGDFFIGEGITNRKTAVHLIRKLLEAGVRVWDCVAQKEWLEAPECWHELEQSNVPLETRTSYANGGERAKALFISIHSNAVGESLRGVSQAARGAVIFTSPGKTTSDDVATTMHEAFAEVFKSEPVSVRRGDWTDGDVDHEANFWVLRKTASSAILGEILFFTNIEDARFLSSSHGQERIAEGYFQGALPWLVR